MSATVLPFRRDLRPAPSLREISAEIASAIEVIDVLHYALGHAGRYVDGSHVHFAIANAITEAGEWLTRTNERYAAAREGTPTTDRWP